MLPLTKQVKLSVQSGSVAAFASPVHHTDTLRQIFAEMGLEDVYPAPRIHRAEEFVIDEANEAGIDATVMSSVFLGLNTTYFVELYDGTQAEIVEESSISSIIPNGTKVKLGLKLDKLNVFTADGEANLTKGVVNDVR